MRLAVLLPLLLAGCVEPGAATDFEWHIQNDGPAPIDYTGTVRGEGVSSTVAGQLAPGAIDTPTSAVSGIDLVAEIRLTGDSRESSGVPFAVDPACPTYRIEAIWDGEEWDIDVAPFICT